MLSLSVLALALGTAQPVWHDDYDRAYQRAIKEKKDLLIHFRADSRLDDALADDGVRERLANFVCLRLPASFEYQGKRLIDHDALAEMSGRPGLAVVSLHDAELPTHETVISAHPLQGSRYHWVPSYGAKEVRHVLDLPAKATLTQRSMMYALLVHPERPRSVFGRAHPAFLGHAAQHSARQASMRHQHHADLIGAINRMGGEMGVGLGNGSEVVAESWGMVVGGENVLEAAFSCVDAWRHSPSHWSAVVGAHRYFGYDLARGSNGTWYATGIFAD
jgi:hypothetical protein